MTKRRILLSMVFLGLSIFAFGRYRVKVMPYLVDETQPYRAKWAAHQPENYALTVEQTGVIHPQAVWTSSVLIFHNNKYAFQKRPADCGKDAATVCSYHLDHPRGYTIDAYFDRAAQCINDSKSAYALLNPFENDTFHGFDTSAQFAGIDLSWAGMIAPRSMCVVTYDPVYGFPTDIVWKGRNAIDGMSAWHITKLEVLTDEIINDPDFRSSEEPNPLITELLNKIGTR
jgi:hypothetical protein